MYAFSNAVLQNPTTKIHRATVPSHLIRDRLLDVTYIYHLLYTEDYSPEILSCLSRSSGSTEDLVRFPRTAQNKDVEHCMCAVTSQHGGWHSLAKMAVVQFRKMTAVFGCFRQFW